MSKIKGLAMVALLLFAVSSAHAADQEAASCEPADIQSAIDACIATGGGTVSIPAGDCTMESGERIVKDVGTTPLRLIGAGEANTTITVAEHQSPGPYAAIDLTGTGIEEIADFTFIGNASADTSYGLGVRGAQACIIHRMTLNTWRDSNILIGNTVGRVVVEDVWMGTPSYAGGYGMRIYGTDYECGQTTRVEHGWGSGDSGVGLVVIENCTWDFRGGIRDGHHPVGMFSNAKCIIRYSEIYADHTIDGHGPDWGALPGDGCRGPMEGHFGTRAIEVHNTRFYSLRGGNNGGTAFAPRSGHFLSTRNEYNWWNIAHQPFMETNHGFGANCTAANGFPDDATFSMGCSGADDGCCEKLHGYIWDNRYNDSDNAYCVANGDPMDCCTGQGTGTCDRAMTRHGPCPKCPTGSFVENMDFFYRAPAAGDPVAESWSMWQCPDPLTGHSGSCDATVAGPSGYRVSGGGPSNSSSGTTIIGSSGGGCFIGQLCEMASDK